MGLAGLVASGRTRCVNASYTRFVAKSTVVMWMDFGCPWSRISLHELERAIAAVGEPVDVRFHSLRLDADAPADYGKTTIENLCEHLSIDVVEAERMLQVVVDAGARVGMAFNFHTARGGSSFDAHRLVRRAADFGVHVQVARDVFTAHFENGELISDHLVLERIGVAAGMPADVVSSLLAGDDETAAVLEDEEVAIARGLEKTPHFLFGGGIETNGVQTYEELRAALQNA